MAQQVRIPRRVSRLTGFFLILITLFLSARALEAQIRWEARPSSPTPLATDLLFQDTSSLQLMGDMSSQGILARLESMTSQLSSYLYSVFSSTKGPHYGQTLDVFRTTAAEIQQMLEAGSTTSADLVELYFEQIERHNLNGMRLHAIISTAPKEQVLSRARALDGERMSKGSRGLFHGIPVIVKDTYNTPSLGMDTTCGSLALCGRKARKDAAIVTKMQELGMIIIGKSNLSEWSNFKGIFNTAGWSAVGGQTQSPYVRGGVVANATFLGHSTPSGSSSGSAVAVAAGFAPITFGAETDGSLVQPASRAAVFALKTTPGLVDASGTQPGNPDFDALGGFARSAQDMANLWNLLFVPGTDLVLKEDLPSSWQSLRVGFVDPHLWQPADFVTEPNEGFMVQSIEEMNHAAGKIALAGGRVARDVSLISTPSGFDAIVGKKFKASLKEYLGLFEGSDLQNLNDLIRFNKDHANQELPPEHPSQGQFEGYAENDMPDDEYNKILKDVRKQALSSIEKALSEHDIDVIMAPGDSRLASVASAAGCPLANVPLGFAHFNGRAHGLTVVARPRGETALLRVMSAWEATFPETQTPPPMMVGDA